MEDTELDLRSLLSVLRRQLRLIVIVALVTAGSAALVVFSLTPKYSASALVLVDTNQRNLLDPSAVSGAVEIDTARVDSEMEILQSNAVLVQVINDADLVRDPDFGVKLGLLDRVMAFLQIARPVLPTGESAVGRVLGTLKSAMDAERLGRTNLLKATVTANDPKRAAEIANAWVDAYIREQVAAKVDSSLKSRDVLEARLEGARSAVAQSEGAFDTYINDSLTQIVKETGRADISSLRDELAALSSTQDANAKRAELAQASLEQRNWTALAETLQSEAMRELARQQSELNTRITTATTQASVDLKTALAGIEERLVDAAAGGLSSLRRSVAVAETQQSEVRQQLRTAVLGSSLSPDILSRIYELQQGSEVARSQYQTLLNRIKDVEAQAAVQIADSRVVSAALAPTRPAFPDIGMTIGLATLGGLGLGLGLAFLRENIVGGILTEDQAAAVLRVPVATALPQERASGNGPGGLADVMVTSPLSAFPEGVRRIKHYLDQANHKRALKRGRTAQAAGRVIIVTSSTANEGKSTIALSLARAFALSRRRAVIVDCDLRKPSVHRMLGLSTSSALVDFLSGPDNAPDLDKLVVKDPATELAVIIGSRPSDLPTDELIASPAFAKLLEAAKAAYDVVILDTPPVGPVVDGLYLAQMADFGLFVLRAGVTSQTEARMALQTIRESGFSDGSLFAVLNQQDRASATYKGRYESYYLSEAE